MAFVLGKASLGPSSECCGFSFQRSFPVLDIYSYISQGTDNGPIGNRCFKWCCLFCVSEERNGLCWAATWAATLKSNGSWPTLSRRCGNVCICFAHTRSNTRCPKDISKGKAIPVQAWTGSWGLQNFEAYRFQDDRQIKVIRSSARCSGRLYFPAPSPLGHTADTYFS